MSLLRNVEYDLRRFRARIFIATTFVLVAFGLLCLRLVYLQLWRYQDLNAQAESNRTAIVPIVPNRGVIMDRNGIVLATNYSAYTLEITPSKIVEPLDEVIEKLSELIDIQGRDKRRFRKMREESKSFESVPIRTRLSDEEVARFAAQRYRFPGVEIRARLFRNYPYNELASHVIGYIGRINQSEKEKLEEQENVGNYRGTDYIGKLGVEQSYERQLHGQTGVHEMETSAGGRAVRRLRSSPAHLPVKVTQPLAQRLNHHRITHQVTKGMILRGLELRARPPNVLKQIFLYVSALVHLLYKARIGIHFRIQASIDGCEGRLLKE